MLRRLFDDRRCHWGGTEPPPRGGVEAPPGGEEAKAGVVFCNAGEKGRGGDASGRHLCSRCPRRRPLGSPQLSRRALFTVARRTALARRRAVAVSSHQRPTVTSGRGVQPLTSQTVGDKLRLLIANRKKLQ